MTSMEMETPVQSLLCLDGERVEVPIIDDDEPLGDVVRKLTNYLTSAIPDVAYTFEQMRSAPVGGHYLRSLIASLSENSHNPLIVSALMVVRWQFNNVEDDDWGLNDSRAQACEYVAWQFLCHLTRREIIDFLLQELPSPRHNSISMAEMERGLSGLSVPAAESSAHVEGERTPLLRRASSSLQYLFGSRKTVDSPQGTEGSLTKTDESVSDPYSFFRGLNALEIATIAHAKKFLAQKVVQRVINDIWNGEIVFWDSLSVHSRKRPHVFNKRTADPYSRLRVPIYRKAFEAAFFISFLLLYYAVLVERKFTGIGIFETLMYIWIAAFAYDEFGGMTDAGIAFYQMDFWSVWNLGIIGTGMAFVITRAIGLARDSDPITDLSFDILSLEALFLVPRICSLVSLNEYFGSLIPVLKEMTKSFFRFLPVVVVLYLGFLTTFTMLARDRLSLREMSWILVKVFYGSANLGFDIAHDISPIFGYGLMLVFISMTNILLISSLISLMSMSLEGVMAHARDEYLFQLSIYVLESSNSRRLTYFMPPLNLIPLLCIRPMRLFLSAGTVRRVRIVLLKATHLPFVALIVAYEAGRRYVSRRNTVLPSMSTLPGDTRQASTIQPDLSSRYSLRLPASGGAHPQTPAPGTGRTGHSPSRPSGARGPGAGRANLTDEMEQLRAQVERLATAIASHARAVREEEN
ncbi:hypothetical protein ASPZODRAFT_134433 [Penicilliopsis zonata CBS 506.65]|uniref:Calcium channel YVC1-like C-terminal transmembrane domain-containing protein n=1 Tax=Penicilliopsis zonata CBS 506.65 TaxID=1073090 RepID=A0A1L9SD04_9EURO|nr:hypothetical protein ASPZODRAFT_134433 [Penicilliopsis zonata CBS 506.65]OJJ45002.1 hypothetical protein ASPZODRAFT_134433 [Penicilliopsis zonata CBS 506.65]